MDNRCMCVIGICIRNDNVRYKIITRYGATVTIRNASVFD